MRTTVTIDDELLTTAKQRARSLGLTLGQYVERALRTVASDDVGRQPAPPIPVFCSGTGVRPDVELDSNRALQELLDDGLPLDKLR